MAVKDSTENPTMWVPICCQTVMRHNFFRSDNGSVAATLVCVSCGKHLTLQPHTSGAIDDYGEGARVLSVVTVLRPARRAADTVGAPADPDVTM